MNSKTLSIALVFFCAPLLLIAQSSSQKKMESGIYNISGEQGLKLKLNDTGKYYNIQPIPVTTTAHIVSTTIEVMRFNRKDHQTLTMVFDDAGTKSIDKAFGNNFGTHQIQVGLVLNNKLTNVIYVMGYIKGPAISLNLGDKYSLKQVQELKAEIDSSH